jgi:hypothetical protein
MILWNNEFDSADFYLYYAALFPAALVLLKSA